jgi:hypothetical protein
MNITNKQKLYADFPRLYRDASNERSCMKWGFQCNDGWFDLLYKLSADIEAEARTLGIDPDSDAWPKAIDVKEKYGTLKFYCDAGEKRNHLDLVPEVTGQIISLRPMPNVPSIRALIKSAEKASASICECCGCPSKLRTDEWWRVTCDKCEAERCERGITDGSKYADACNNQ